MPLSPPIPDALRAAVPLAARAAILAVVVAMKQQIDGVRAEVAHLRDRRNRDSSNSSVPPSADPAPPRVPSGKRKGGQPGHPWAVRPLRLADVIHHRKPEHCRRCRHRLDGTDPGPLIHQVHEIPATRPYVTEYRRHRLACSQCEAVTRAELPVGVASGYGPRAQVVRALLSGVCRLGERMVSQICNDLFGMSIGAAATCDFQHKTAGALEPVAAEVHTHLAGKPADVDETGWREGGKRAWLWVAVTAGVTAFVIRRSRARTVLGELIPGARAY